MLQNDFFSVFSHALFIDRYYKGGIVLNSYICIWEMLSYEIIVWVFAVLLFILFSDILIKPFLKQNSEKP